MRRYNYKNYNKNNMWICEENESKYIACPSASILTYCVGTRAQCDTNEKENHTKLFGEDNITEESFQVPFTSLHFRQSHIPLVHARAQ